MLRCVPLIVTVRMMRNAAAMDVDISVWLQMKVFRILRRDAAAKNTFSMHLSIEVFGFFIK